MHQLTEGFVLGGLEGEGFAVVGDGVGEAAEVLEGGAQVGVDVGRVWVEAEGGVVLEAGAVFASRYNTPR